MLHSAKGQDKGKHIDLILVIDEQISQSISGVKIIVRNGDSTKTLEPLYYPGNLTFNEGELDLLTDKSTTSIFLEFRTAVYKPKDEYRFYKIEMKKQWLADYYNIIKIYNLNNKKYQNQFDAPKNGDKYVYELASPSNSFLIIRKKPVR
ncbi:hypothetical protein GA0116948_1288 [Chitinophaga costaii]|uniref:Uncharacterized protein n=2 Tax=Chitinophaga costaii TaxID=1335309 RepID=A0A1C4G7W6_9BACT|nr:hypothetical protein DCM91_20525 [Chitinophaga costaii]SCC64246.1 hypothetical protein GA0116948_1288 [Chitinophaga costaii]